MRLRLLGPLGGSGGVLVALRTVCGSTGDPSWTKLRTLSSKVSSRPFPFRHRAVFGVSHVSFSGVRSCSGTRSAPNGTHVVHSSCGEHVIIRVRVCSFVYECKVMGQGEM